MLTTLKHRFDSLVPDDGDPDIVGPDEWDDDHISDHAFVVLGSIPTNLTGARQLTNSGLLSLTDAGAGSTVTLGVSSAAVVSAVQAAGAALTRVNDTNVTLTLGGTPGTALLQATSMTLGWTGLLGLARGGTHADLSATGGAGKYLKQASVGGDITVVVIPASDIGNPGNLTRVSDTNIGLTLTGTPIGALLQNVTLTAVWVGLLGLARGGTHADLSATGGAGQYLKQASVGADITVGTIAAGDLPGSFSGFANPSASIGLSAVNGSATTAMRSDAAPALSQTIAPTWTGLHKWSATLGVTPDDTAAGLLLVTAGTAAAGAQQISPSLHFRGSGWKTNATAGAQVVDFRNYLLPVQGTSASDIALVWEAGVNGTYATAMYYQYANHGPFGLNGYLNVNSFVNATTGFQVGGLAPNGNVLRGQGTYFASDVLQVTDLGGAAALTKTDDTNVTMALGGTPASALLAATSLTLGWTGTLAIARGGTGSATPFANPSASVGLAAVNGSATTFMRSDAAPALSQNIAPTWTGLHTWSLATGGYFQEFVGTGTGARTWGFAILTTGDYDIDDITGGASVARFKSGGVLDLTTGYRVGNTAASGNYLRGNGTNFVSAAIAAGDLPGSFSGFANPSASIGLATVNGSATTAMRSDGAPALSQAINPTWTSTHNWTRSVTGVYWQTWASTAASAVTWGFANNAGPTMSLDEVGVAQRLLIYGSAAASGAGIAVVNWLRVGSASAPTNTTAGDFTTTRGFITNLSVGTQNVASGAGADLLVLASGSRSTLHLGDNTANGYQRIEMQSRFTGASGAGQWMFESIDTEFYFYSLTNSGYLFRASPTGEFGFGGEAAVAGVALSIPAKTYAFRFHTTTFLPSVLTDSVKVIDSSGNIRYIGLYANVG